MFFFLFSFFHFLTVSHFSRHFFSSLKKKISLTADGPHYYHPACGHKGSSHLSPRFSRLTSFLTKNQSNFLSRCKFSTLTTRQPMVEFYLLTFPRFPLRKKEHKSYFGKKNRTHDFRTIIAGTIYSMYYSILMLVQKNLIFPTLFLGNLNQPQFENSWHAINLLPDIILLTQSYYQWGTRLNTM